MARYFAEGTLHLGLLISFFIILIWSLINPEDWLTWFFEVSSVVVGVVLLVVTYSRFKFTPVAYILIWLAAVVMVIGGHYGYAEMPLFEWFKEVLDLERNYYDRLGHFMQGATPAIVLREIILRRTPLRSGKLLALIVISSTLGISALYELVEWGAIEIGGFSRDKILEPQGDHWDTQWDMFMALAGALFSLVTLRRLHDKELKD